MQKQQMLIVKKATSVTQKILNKPGSDGNLNHQEISSFWINTKIFTLQTLVENIKVILNICHQGIFTNLLLLNTPPVLTFYILVSIRREKYRAISG